MASSTIAIIIVAVAMVLYVTAIIPLSTTTILAMLAMAFTGVLTYSQAFSGYASTACLLTASLMVIGEAIEQSGLSKVIGDWGVKRLHIKRKWLVVLLFIVAGIASIFFTSTTVLLSLMPIIDSMSRSSNGEIIRRKDAYFPVAVAGILSSNMSIIGSISMLTSIAMLEESPLWTGGSVSLMAPFKVGAPAYFACLLIYMTFGYAMQDKLFDFPDNLPLEAEKETAEVSYNKRKQMIVAVVFVACLVCFCTEIVNMAAAGLAGAAVLVLTGCVDEKKAYRNLDWRTIIIVGGAIGFAKGLEVSGAASVIAEFVLAHCGALAQSAYAMCIIMLLISTMISNFCSNTAAAVMLVPISLMLAQNFAYNPFPFVMAVALGVNISLATPICVSTITMTLAAGYRTKDYIRMGGFLNLVAFVVTALALRVFYF